MCYHNENTQTPHKRQTRQSINSVSWAGVFVWNYVNELSYKYLNKHNKFLSAYDIAPYTKGTSKECDLHSQTIQAITEEYVIRKKQFKKQSYNGEYPILNQAEKV